LSLAASSLVDDESGLPVRPGQVLDGKFRVERIVGEGAMGLVVEATHLDLDERVALKFLRREARERPDIVTRFAREARAAAKISSDHVARVYDVGGTEDGSPFIVMEFLEGMDLEVVLGKHGPLPISDVAEHVIQACEGLTAAHAIGIVHRDIKPANLFRVERAGILDVKLVDFGISKAAITGTGTFDDIDLASADTTQIMGSPHYMSPEQIRSTKDVDGRADLWSLGVVLFELLTGTTPFTATDVTGIIAQVLHEPHRSVCSVRPDVPQGLQAVIDQCLEKDPSKRYQSAADLAVALLPFAPKRARAVVERATARRTRASGQVAVDSLPPPPSTPVAVPPSPSIVTSTVVAVPQRRPFVWFALACVILGLLGGVIALSSRMRSAPKAEPEALTTPAAPTPTTAPAPEPKVAEPAAAATAAASEAAPPPSAAAAARPTTPTATTAGLQQKSARPPVRPAGASKPTAAPPSTALPSVESDIRRER
jgi:serine/threonine protein kinase